MITSKYKSGVAYASTVMVQIEVCKDKSAPNLSRTHNNHNISSDSKENIYHHLMDGLQPDQSQYINQLLLKHQRKSHKMTPQTISNKPQPPTSSPIIPQHPNFHSPQPITHNLQPKTPQQPSCPATMTHRALQGMSNSKKGKVCEISVGMCKDSKNKNGIEFQSHFLENLGDYLRVLGGVSNPPSPRAQRNSVRPQHRPTYNRYSKESQIEDESTFLENDHLRGQLARQNRSIADMKHLLKSIWTEMEEIRYELASQRETRLYYEKAFEQFVSKMKPARDSFSRDRNFQPKHVKRYSHVPAWSGLSDEAGSSHSTLNSLVGEGQPWKEARGLKKKGKQHKSKFNEVPSDYCFERPSLPCFRPYYQ